MPVFPAVPRVTRRLVAALASLVVLILAIDQAVALPLPGEGATAADPLVEAVGHLVVSELMTGGASASDEFIELYNPAATPMPLEGLEVVYVTASGATVTRKASWGAGAPALAPGTHLLIANSAGAFAGLADVAYANGLAATGGSVAIRIIGASTAIDAVGWGNASTWLETGPAPAPAAGNSLERLPGGSSGSTQDTDNNFVDFAIQPLPDPQNSGSPPVPTPSTSPLPSGTPAVTPTATPSTSPTVAPTAEPSLTETPSLTPSPIPTATPAPTSSPSPTPAPTPWPISIAAARELPDGTAVTVEGLALTAGDFTDGGGYLFDAGAGIAVLVADGTYGRGELLRVTGTVDDRYAQRTIRATADMVVSVGTGSDPLALDAATGSIGEGVEGRLVELTGVITSSVTTLSGGLAWDVDDGSGAIRVLVGTTTGIDTSSWSRGVGLTLIGVVGQRDSSGSGTSGYRVQPRDAADVLAVEPIATPSPTPTPEPTATSQPTASPAPSSSPSPTPAPEGPLVSISEARAAATGTHQRIRGVVTASSGLIEAGSAIVQDATAAILVRLGTDVGTLALGQFVELDGTRATKAGMLSLRVVNAPLHLGTQADPDAPRRATGSLGEADEARLVIVRGAIGSAISRPRGGNVSFAIDDGSGPIRVTVSSQTGIGTGSLTRGAWIELRAVLTQETTGSAPTNGYRLWPRVATDLRVIAAPVSAAQATTCCASVQASERAIVGGNLPDAFQESGASPVEGGIAPILARPQPTSSPRPQVQGAATEASPDHGAAAGGLVVSGMGLAALAGLAAWFRRRPSPDDPAGLAEPSPASDDAPTQALPRLSVLRGEGNDAQKERRILPPT